MRASGNQLLLASLFLIAGWAWGSERGTTAADFLKLGTGAAAIGAGEAATGRPADLNAAWFNPAALANLERTTFSASHLNWIAEAQYESLLYARPVMGVGTLAAGLLWLHMPDIPGRDSFGADDGSLRAYDLGAQAAFARDFSLSTGMPGLCAGANVKIIHRELAGNQASGAALDIGGQCLLLSNLHAGVSILNAGYFSGFGSGSEPLPFMVRVGANWKIDLGMDHQFDLPIDLVQALDHSLRINAGVDYCLLKNFHLRLGYKLGYDTEGLQAGAGLAWQNLVMDYALKTMGVFGITHYLSLSLGWGKPVTEQGQNEAGRLLRQAEEQYHQSQYSAALNATEKALEADPKNSAALALREKLTTVLQLLSLPGENSQSLLPAVPEMTPDQKEELGAPAPLPGEVAP